MQRAGAQFKSKSDPLETIRNLEPARCDDKESWSQLDADVKSQWSPCQELHDLQRIIFSFVDRAVFKIVALNPMNFLF